MSLRSLLLLPFSIFVFLTAQAETKEKGVYTDSRPLTIRSKVEVPLLQQLKLERESNSSSSQSKVLKELRRDGIRCKFIQTAGVKFEEVRIERHTHFELLNIYYATNEADSACRSKIEMRFRVNDSENTGDQVTVVCTSQRRSSEKCDSPNTLLRASLTKIANFVRIPVTAISSEITDERVKVIAPRSSTIPSWPSTAIPAGIQ